MGVADGVAEGDIRQTGGMNVGTQQSGPVFDVGVVAPGIAYEGGDPGGEGSGAQIEPGQ